MISLNCISYRNTSIKYMSSIKKKERETCLLFKRTVVKHDVVIINFGRKSMMKTFVLHANYRGTFFSLFSSWRYFGSPVSITQLFNIFNTCTAQL